MTRNNAESDGIGEQELAQYLFEHDQDDSVWQSTVYDLESGERAIATIFQMRIPVEEMDEIAKAALFDGGNVAEFVRTAALEKARALTRQQEASPEEMRKMLSRARELVDLLQAELTSTATAKEQKAPAA